MSVDIERTVVYERIEDAFEAAPGFVIDGQVLQFVTTDCMLTPLEIQSDGHTIYLRPEDVAALAKIVAPDAFKTGAEAAAKVIDNARREINREASKTVILFDGRKIVRVIDKLLTRLAEISRSLPYGEAP